MKTKFLSFTSIQALQIIENNNVLAFPTETVFGLGITYKSLDAFNKLCSLKKRIPDKPFTIMVSNKEQIGYFVDLNSKMKKLIDIFMPGEVTFLFPCKKGLSPWLTLNHPTVGIRIPNYPELCDFIDKTGPLLVTSCNMSNEPPLLNEEDVYNVFNNKIAGIVKGECISKIPSTIVLIDEDVHLIRQGSVDFNLIKEEFNK